MDGIKIRPLLAVAIGGILILVVALWIRERRIDPASASSSATATEPNARLVDIAELDVAGSRPDRAALTAIPSGVLEAPAVDTEDGEGTLSGMLLDRIGRPILASQAGVGLFDAHGYRRYADATETGRYEFRGLQVGSYSLSAGAHGYFGVEDTHEVESSRPEVQRDFRLIPQPKLKIRAVTPDGQSLQHALKQTSLQGPEALLLSVATRERPSERFVDVSGNNPFGMGRFWTNDQEPKGLTGEHIGVIWLNGELPAHVSLVHYHHVLQSVEALPGADEVTFVLTAEELLADLATVRFRLEDERTGRGIPGAFIFLQGISMRGFRSEREGTVTIEGIAPGRYRVWVDAEGHERLDLSFEAGPGITELGSLRLGEALSVRVHVVDENRTPHRAKFDLRVLDPETRRVVHRDSGLAYAADGSGVLDLKRLGRKLYCLQFAFEYLAEQPGGSPNQVGGNVILDTRDGPISDVEIVLRPAGRLVLRMDDPDPSSWTFQIYDERDLWVKSGHFYDRMPWPIELAPGTYRVALGDRDEKEVSSRFVKVGAEPVVLEFSR